MKRDYTIKLQENAQPCAIYVVVLYMLQCSYTLHAKVQAELNRMENLEVISWVDEPTQWCTGMVVAPKNNGFVCI